MIYKIGIIGYGVMGKTRHQAITEIKRGKVIAISEPSLGERVDGIPNVSHDEILNNPEIDVLVVCTPNFLNKELTIKGLKAGKHVFCEKPPAFTGADIEEIIEAEKNSGKKLMYGFNHRHHDSVLHMKQLISSGAYGKVLWLRGRYGKSVTKDYFNQWRAKKELAGGGILMDQGIHMLDLFLFLSGDFDVVKAEVSNLWMLKITHSLYLRNQLPAKWHRCIQPCRNGDTYFL
jgi:1,5-anhydro-D-fructose reductase (1,5-anhydro-D-mannitol-forming)